MTAPLVILAGGKSTRMGGTNKAEIKINGKRMIDIIYAKAKTQCKDIYISASHDYDLSLPHITDDPALPGGPAGGILSIAQYFSKLPNPPKGFFTVPVDGPNFPDDFCGRIYTSHASAIAGDEDRTHPSFAWWRLEDLIVVAKTLSLTESLSLHRLAHACNAQNVLWTAPNLFFNINTANDLSNYLTDTISKNNS